LIYINTLLFKIGERRYRVILEVSNYCIRLFYSVVLKKIEILNTNIKVKECHKENCSTLNEREIICDIFIKCENKINIKFDIEIPSEALDDGKICYRVIYTFHSVGVVQSIKNCVSFFSRISEVKNRQTVRVSRVKRIFGDASSGERLGPDDVLMHLGSFEPNLFEIPDVYSKYDSFYFLLKLASID